MSVDLLGEVGSAAANVVIERTCSRSIIKLGSLSTSVFETRTATGREHFECKDRIVSQIFILLISDAENQLSNVNVVV